MPDSTSYSVQIVLNVKTTSKTQYKIGTFPWF